MQENFLIKYNCEKCRDLTFIINDNTATPCECRELREAENILKYSGISKEFRNKTFENFNYSFDVQTIHGFTKATKYIKDFSKKIPSRNKYNIFLEQVGSEKTHLCIAISNKLISNGIGVVYMPFRDVITTIKQNILDEDYYTKQVSIHANAFKDVFNSARGTETFVASNASENSKRGARFLQDEIFSAMKSIDSDAKDRGVKVCDFTVIYRACMPSVLIEYGFYTNYGDLMILKNNRKELVEATVRAICRYFGVSYVCGKDDVYYRVVCGSYKNSENAEYKVKELESKGFLDCFIDVKK